MTMPVCKPYEEDLVDHALGQPAAPALAAHLAGCAPCRARLGDERRLAATMDGLLESTLDVAPAPGFDLAVKRRLRGTRPASASVRTRWIAGVTLATLAAVIAILWVRATPLVTRPSPAVADLDRPSSTAAPTATTPLDTPRASSVPVTSRRAPSRRVSKPRAEPAVLVPPDHAAAVRRYMEGLQTAASAEIVVTAEPALPFAPREVEVGTLEDLPRLSTEQSAVEPATALDRLVTGGDV